MTARRALSTGLALVTAASIFASVPIASAAPSTSLAAAKKQAAQLARQVDHLNDQAELASEDYDAAEEQLGKAVNSYLGVQTQLEAAQASDAAGRQRVDDQAAALYEAGGSIPIYAEALNGDDLGDVVDRLSMAGNVLNNSALSVRASSSQTAGLVKLNAKLAAMAGSRTQLQASAQRKAALVRGLLAEQTQLLGSADSQVKAITVQLQQAAAAAAAHKFAVALAQAQALAAQGNAFVDNAAAPTPAAGAAILAAQSRIGTPYVWGAVGPADFDCSGLTGWAYAQAGITLPRTSREQWNVGHHVALADLQPGDLLFWATDTSNPATIHHVAIYAGNDLMIAAPHTGAVVSLQQVYLTGYIGATRPTG